MKKVSKRQQFLNIKDRLKNLILKNSFIFVIIIAFLSRFFLYRYYEMITWDGAAFIMNAKYFIGQKIYFEFIRPPVFPLILSIGILLGDVYVIPIVLSMLNIIVTYLLVKKIFNEKVALISALLIASNPSHLINSGFFLAEIASSLFLILSIFFLYNIKEKVSNLYLASFFFALSFLSKYQNFLFIIPILFFLYKEKLIFRKETIVSAFIVLFVASPWLLFNFINYGDPFESIKYALLYPSEASKEPFLFYFFRLQSIFGYLFVFILISFIFYLTRIKEKKYFILYSFILTYLLAASLFPHKEERYMLPIVPLLLILPANFIMELKQIKVNKLIKRIVLFLFFLLIFASIPETIVSIHANKSLLCYSNIINSAKYVSGTNGSVIAPNWPLIAYYGNVKAIPFTYEPEDFDWYVSYHNVSYVIVSLDKKVLESFGSSAGEKTSYVINKSFFDNKKYLVMEKEFNDECGIYLIYGVRNWTY